MVEFQLQSYYVLLMTINVTFALVIMLGACLCCKKKVPKNDLLGLEGMVKLKNPDEVAIVSTMTPNVIPSDLNVSSQSNADSEKRASTAAHRSLPDIPITETNGDTGSELYETVADKMLGAKKTLPPSPTPSIKKQASISQHSSISQADDISSPYTRVKNSIHDYAKVLSAEHPYAQLNLPSTTGNLQNSNAVLEEIPSVSGSRLSHNSIDLAADNETNAPVEIAAASAIAGMISASQDLPYMTPPIASMHFSGDSQDSSKGYTSISVREPIANILGQQSVKAIKENVKATCDTSDSHYATVSDDSDETYAAIDDANARNILNTPGDIYTSGSETYAQIQPVGINSIIVAVEINNISHNTSNSQDQGNSSNPVNVSRNIIDHQTPVPPPVDTLRAQMHSRQASCSSNNSSSLGNLGSPKPEKRQANSPLPPTPKSNTSLLHTFPDNSNLNLTSGRSSIISVHDIGCIQEANALKETDSKHIENQENSPQKKTLDSSPSKDIEGMYAKVMKKNKFSRSSPSPQQNSPIMNRRSRIEKVENSRTELETLKASKPPTNIICHPKKQNSSLEKKDHGYETIPTSEIDANALSNPTRILQNVKGNAIDPSIIESTTNSNKTLNIIDPDSMPPTYETLKSKKGEELEPEKDEKSEYDPNYEVLKSTTGLSDDGYAKVEEKKRDLDEADMNDGYSKVKCEDSDYGAVGGYSTIKEPKGTDANHNYASIAEAKDPLPNVGVKDLAKENDSDHYSNINESHSMLPAEITVFSATTVMKSENSEDFLKLGFAEKSASPSSVNSYSLLNTSSMVSPCTITTNTSTISSRQTLYSSQYESLTSETDPNYESLRYSTHSDNHYEQLNQENSDNTEEDHSNSAMNTESPQKSCEKPAILETPHKDSNSEVLVHDYFQV